MGMDLKPGEEMDENDGIIDINTTPLIDVMLVLLIMLIITIPLQTQSVSIVLPRESSSLSLTQPEIINLLIDFDNSLTWNGEEISGKADLIGRLTRAAQMSHQPQLYIRASRLVRYDTVAQILADAQRIGIQKIGILQQK